MYRSSSPVIFLRLGSVSQDSISLNICSMISMPLPWAPDLSTMGSGLATVSLTRSCTALSIESRSRMEMNRRTIFGVMSP